MQSFQIIPLISQLMQLVNIPSRVFPADSVDRCDPSYSLQELILGFDMKENVLQENMGSPFYQRMVSGDKVPYACSCEILSHQGWLP